MRALYQIDSAVPYFITDEHWLIRGDRLYLVDKKPLTRTRNLPFD